MNKLNDSQSMHAKVAYDIKVTYDITYFNHMIILGTTISVKQILKLYVFGNELTT